MNCLDFGLILQSFRGAVENGDFWGKVQKPIVSAEKTRHFFFLAFLLFPTRLLWFRAKMAFLIVGEIIDFLPQFTT